MYMTVITEQAERIKELEREKELLEITLWIAQSSKEGLLEILTGFLRRNPLRFTDTPRFQQPGDHQRAGLPDAGQIREDDAKREC